VDIALPEQVEHQVVRGDTQAFFNEIRRHRKHAGGDKKEILMVEAS
jgi:hypothetical protein